MKTGGPEKIVIENLGFSYNSQPILEDISVTIREKEIVTIIGPNGGGKTTLLRLILGLLKPREGFILIDGQRPNLMQKKMGYVPQYVNFDKGFPITVFEIVLSGRIKKFGFYSGTDKKRAEAALEKVGLTSIKHEPFSILSGGQIQRMLIARALVTDADLLLLDEPTSNIDPAAGDSLNTLLKRLNEKMTIVLVTHDTGFVANITDRVLCINKKLVEHPIDSKFSKIVASAYSGQSALVRHQTLLSHEHGDSKDE